MPRKIIHGTGMTQREVWVYDPSQPYPPNWKTWNELLDEGGGFFGAVSMQAANTCEAIIASATGEVPVEDTPEAFAKQISKLLRVAKADIEKGDADRAARWAFDAGVMWGRATMKWEHEPTWQTGEAQRTHLEETRRAANQRRQQHKQAEKLRCNAKAAKIWLRRPELSKEAVAKAIINDRDFPAPTYLAAGGDLKPMSERTVRGLLQKPGEAG